jgi:hypothetical protein
MTQPPERAKKEKRPTIPANNEQKFIQRQAKPTINIKLK